MRAKKIIGGKEKACPFCGNHVVYIKLDKNKVISQCKKCGCMTNGKVKEESKVFEFNEKGEMV